MTPILFLNRFFFPDHSATSQIVSDLAFHLAGTGREVHVLSSRQRYDDPRADLPEFEQHRGVSIHRISTTQFGRATLAGRGLDYLSFYASLWRRLNEVAPAGGVLVAKTDPPMLGALAEYAGRSRGYRLVNWLQDLYPEVATRLGVPLMNGMLGAGLTRLRDRSLRSAAANVVIGDRMAENLRRLGIPEDRVRVIPNWCDETVIRPVTDAGAALRREWGLEDGFVFGYSGNLGRAHEFETVLGAAQRLVDGPRIRFLVIGGGQKVDELTRRVRELHLEQCFRFLPYQDEATLNESLSVPHLHWISLRPELEGLIVPSKFYRVAAVGRPTVVIGARDGELATLVQRHRCGFAVQSGDADGLAVLLSGLAGDRDTLAPLGLAARAMIEEHYSRSRALAKWQGLLDDIEAAG
jgi:glycosyltransferase involved in cell wall biosynthesis